MLIPPSTALALEISNKEPDVCSENKNKNTTKSFFPFNAGEATVLDNVLKASGNGVACVFTLTFLMITLGLPL